MKKVAVSLSIGVQPIKPQVEKILSVLQRANVEGIVILAGHSVLDPIGSADARLTADAFPEKVFLALASRDTWSTGYLTGMHTAHKLGADYVISMDADGSHDPNDLPRFIELLEHRPVVLASRFLPEAKNKYPAQRKIISFVSTLLTRWLLTEYYLTDFTSGYEGIRADIFAELFARYPIEGWVCVRKGPYHLQNTELRLALIDMGCPITEIPIVYGGGNKGKTFNLKFMCKVLLGFLTLVHDRRLMRKKLSGGMIKEHI